MYNSGPLTASQVLCTYSELIKSDLDSLIALKVELYKNIIIYGKYMLAY